jgi:hypothetical protein
VAAALLWRAAELHTMVYEGMPGILTGLIVATALSRAAEHQPAKFGVYATKGDS